MTGVSGLTAKQLEIVKHGAVLTGNTFDEEVRARLKRLSRDQVFYFPKGRGGDNKWHVDVRLAERIASYAGKGIGYDVSRSKVSERSERFDCTDERFHDPTITYEINDDVDWGLIHVTKKDGSNEKDGSKSNNHLVCPEDECGLRLYTRMGSQRRELRRKHGQSECLKCRKINTPTRSRPDDPPPEELKYVESEGAIPRNRNAVTPPPLKEPVYFRSEHGAGLGSSSSQTSPSWTGNSGPDPKPIPVPEPEPHPGPEEPAVVPEPETDRPSLTQEAEPPAEDKKNGLRKTLVLGALALLVVLVLVLWVFLQ